MKKFGKLVWVGLMGVELILVGSAQAADPFPNTVAVQGFIMQNGTTPLSLNATGYNATFTINGATVCTTGCTTLPVAVGNGVFTLPVVGCLTPNGGAGMTALLADLTGNKDLKVTLVLDYNAGPTCAEGASIDTFSNIPIYPVPLALLADQATHVTPAAIGGAGTIDLSDSGAGDILLKDTTGSVAGANTVLTNDGAGHASWAAPSVTSVGTTAGNTPSIGNTTGIATVTGGSSTISTGIAVTGTNSSATAGDAVQIQGTQSGTSSGIGLQLTGIANGAGSTGDGLQLLGTSVGGAGIGINDSGAGSTKVGTGTGAVTIGNTTGNIGITGKGITETVGSNGYSLVGGGNAIGIGNDAAANAVTIGSTNTTASVAIQSGSGGIKIGANGTALSTGIIKCSGTPVTSVNNSTPAAITPAAQYAGTLTAVGYSYLTCGGTALSNAAVVYCTPNTATNAQFTVPVMPYVAQAIATNSGAANTGLIRLAFSPLNALTIGGVIVGGTGPTYASATFWQGGPTTNTPASVVSYSCAVIN